MARPTKMTNEVIQKLEDSFVKGMSDREACTYVNICPQTLYNYCNDNPDFLERKERLKDTPKIRAKINIAKALEDGDKEMSKWYLERKAKDEFSTKQAFEVAGQVGLPAADKTKLAEEFLRQMVDDWNEDHGENRPFILEYKG